jgi:transcription antitermination factor NusG
MLGVDDEWPMFVPARVYNRGGKRVTIHLMEGYAFVASGLDEVDYFALEDDRYIVTKVMTASSPGGLRVLKTIPDRQIENLRQKLVEEVSSDIEPGMAVYVADGKYKGLDGVVLGLEAEYALVSVELRSLKIVAEIPRIFLATHEDDDSPVAAAN